MVKQFAGRVLPPLLKHIPKNRKIFYPFYVAGLLEEKEAEYRSRLLPPALDGLRIAYASDIHFGPYFNENQARDLCGRLVSFGADLLVLGGDYGDRLDSSIAFFNSIPPFPDGMTTLAVLGNHDYGRKKEKIDPLLRAMRSRNVIPLINTVWTLERGGAAMAVCAPDDAKSGLPDFGPLIKGSASADFILFVPHSPDLIPDAQVAGFQFHLALCGHTHGGQIVLFGRSVRSSSRYGDRYRAGWYRENGSDIHVSSGVGTSILPMRIGTRAEIHRFVLKAEG